MRIYKSVNPQGLMYQGFLVRWAGLEPARLPTRPSNVRVCRFRHHRMSGCCLSGFEGYVTAGHFFIIAKAQSLCKHCFQKLYRKIIPGQLIKTSLPVKTHVI